MCFATLSLSIVLFVYTPGNGPQLAVLAGATLFVAIGEFAVRIAEQRSRE